MDDAVIISISQDGRALGSASSAFPGNSVALRRQLEASAKSGTSRRRIPEIIADVKAKMLANEGLDNE